MEADLSSQTVQEENKKWRVAQRILAIILENPHLNKGTKIEEALEVG